MFGKIIRTLDGNVRKETLLTFYYTSIMAVANIVCGTKGRTLTGRQKDALEAVGICFLRTSSGY
jgi:hypothetical protein